MSILLLIASETRCYYERNGDVINSNIRFEEAVFYIDKKDGVKYVHFSL